MKISVLGLGLMGRPMAQRLAQDGFDVRGWNRSAVAIDGISLCASLSEAVDADVLLLMLADSAAVDSVLTELGPKLQPGQLVIDMGSSNPEHSKGHAARLSAAGIGWVDAPVSGGPEGAANGALAIMAGASEADFARAEPIFRTLGGNVVHMGGPGAGHATKLVNQIIVCLTIEAVAEGLALGEICGLDLKRVQQALRGGSADSLILQIQGTRMIERDYQPGGRVTTLRKDLSMALELARQSALDLPHVTSTIALSQSLVAAGDGALDASALHKLRAPTPAKRADALV